MVLALAFWVFICGLISPYSDAALLVSARLDILLLAASVPVFYLARRIDIFHINLAMLIIASILVLMSIVEFFLQEYIFPASIRTSFSNIPGYEWYTDRSPPVRDGLILVQGSYLWNHPFAGMICIFSGFLLPLFTRNLALGVVVSAAVFFAISVTGTRAAFVGLLCGFFTWFLFESQKIKFISVCVTGLLLSVFILDGASNVFYFDDLKHAPELVSPKALEYNPSDMKNLLINSSQGIISPELADKLFSSGTLGIRLGGLLANLQLIDQWWLFGYGPGAFFDPEHVLSSAVQYDDPGLIFVFLFDTGLIGGGLICMITLLSVIKGFSSRSPVYKSMASGIVAWFVFSLSSWAIWPLLPAMTLALLVWRAPPLSQEQQVSNMIASPVI